MRGAGAGPAGPARPDGILRMGVLGGGQLGRMLALAGIPLGVRFRFLEPGEAPPAGAVGEVVRGVYDDSGALERFAEGLDVVTYEFENVPVAAVRHLAAGVPVFPPPAALEAAQDRLVEKQTFQAVGIPTAPFRAVDTREELVAGAAELGFPCVLKTRRFGYDGKGQAVLRGPDDVEGAWATLGARPLLLEAFVRFRRELSCLAVRGRTGEVVTYPLVRNEHRDGILRMSRAPVPDLDPGSGAEAVGFTTRLLEHLDYTGVLALELFENADGLLANEIAPRVHNSGHWTQDGARTSQFENHLRAVLGLPLGSPEVPAWAGMVNLIGGVPPREELLATPGARIHLYDKASHPGRKVGHVNVTGGSPEELELRLGRVAALADAWGEG